MDIATLQAFEDRAAAAEERLADLETKLTNGTITTQTSSSLGGLDVQRYIAELQSLKTVLLAAKSEQETLEARCTELETANSKLAYQIKHLKQAVREGDARLAGEGR